MGPSSRAVALRRSLAAGPVGRGVRQARRHLAILRQTGRLRPGHIALAASGHTIHVDPEDRRGREIVRGLGRGHQPALLDLWRRAVDAADPTLVIDVGANYGEFVLDARYPTGTRVLAVEANPRIVPLLQRSIDAHPDGDRIELHAVLAGWHDGGEATLLVDPRWSGSAGTSLDRSQDGDVLVELPVPVRTVDALVAGTPVPPGPLLLKVDTEGSEADVLGGMSAVLAAATEVVAIVEFDPSHLRRRTDPAALFDVLAGLGRCWAVDWDGRAIPAATPPEAASDLVVVSEASIAAALRLPT
ncbi:MAG: FkbM family methyltransferase [Acidimicrobiales bacterium]